MLGGIVDILDSKRKPITKRDRVAGPYPYYGATGVLDWVSGFIFDEPLVLIGEDGAKWGAGDASAFSVSGKTWVNNHAHVLRPHREIVTDEWLIYYLNAADLTEFISGMTVPKLNQGRLREIPIPVPPLEEQKRILAVLDQAFAALDRARALAEANLADAEELFENTLEAVFERFASSELILPLGEAVHPDCRLSYGIVQPGDEVAGGLPIVRPVDLGGSVISLSGLKRISPDRAEGYSRTTLTGAELLLCVRGTTGEVSMASPELAGANVTRGIVPVRFDPVKVDLEFAYFQMRSPFMRKQIATKTYGAALMQINIRDVRELEFVCPSLDIQQKAKTEVRQLHDRTERLIGDYQAKLDDLASLRQSLLQRAFVGELT